MSGTVRVDTIELDSCAVACAQLAETLEEWGSAWRQALDEAQISDEAHAVAQDLFDFAARLRRAAQTYAGVDEFTTLAMQRASDVCLWLAGRLLPVTLLLFGPVVLSTAGSSVVARILLEALPPHARSRFEHAQTGAWATALSSPAVVRTIELAVGSLDEGAMGVLGLPLPLALGIGSAGLGVTSLAGTSRLASRINSMLADPPAALPASAGTGTSISTEVHRVSTESVAAPRDVAELVARVPHGVDNGPQVRIEEFGDTHVVYIGGTVEATLGAGTQPWDMSSNLAALGGDASASENAVRRAMTDAGIGQEDPVILVGHSQGGLVAARIAQSTDVSASAVITAGAPIHGMSMPAHVPVVALEHTDDLVPALGGTVTHPQPSIVYVQRRALDSDASGDDTLLPAHRLEAYVSSAQRLSARGNPTVDHVRDEIARLMPTGTSTLWRATRIAGER